MPTGVWYGNLREIDLVVDWVILLKRICKELDKGDWIDLTQDRNKWFAFV